MNPSTYYAVLLALVLGVGCASTKDESGNSLPLSLTEGTYAGEGPFVEWPVVV